MEAKKNPAADIHLKRPLIFSLSLTISLSLAIVAFEWRWSTSGKQDHQTERQHYLTEELLDIPPTQQPPVTTPPPPKQVITNAITEVPDQELVLEKISEITFDQEAQPPVIAAQVIVVQPTEEIEFGDEIFIAVESAAEFIGGPAALTKFIKSNLRYPKTARRLGTEGKVFVKAVIEKDGTLTNATVLKGISQPCDEEALRVMGLSPKWIPGKQRGRPVRTQVVVPIIFKLSGETIELGH